MLSSPGTLLKLVLGCLLCLSAQAQNSQRNLTVELRTQWESAAAPGTLLATQGPADTFTQSLQVRNGESASFRLQEAMPVQWTQSVTAPSPSSAASGASQSSAAYGVNNALIWVEAGQSLVVQAKWPGGKQPVTLVLEVVASAPVQRSQQDVPGQGRETFATTVQLRLGEWSTVASSGESAKPAQAGSYSSAASRSQRKLLQIRVLAP